MKSNSDKVRKHLDNLVSERDAMISQIDQINLKIEELNVKINIIKEALGENIVITPGSGSLTIQGGTPVMNTSVAIRADEYFGKKFNDAAEMYIRKIGSAVSLEQIIDGVKRGGFRFETTPNKMKLYKSLALSNRKFRLIDRDTQTFGLVDFYKNIPKKDKKRGMKEETTTKEKNVLGMEDQTIDPTATVVFQEKEKAKK